MKIHHYTKDIICFEDYPAHSGANVFLEFFISGDKSFSLCVKYDFLSNYTNARANLVNGSWIADEINIAGEDSSHTRNSDLDKILDDESIISQIDSKIRARK